MFSYQIHHFSTINHQPNRRDIKFFVRYGKYQVLIRCMITVTLNRQIGKSPFINKRKSSTNH